MLIITLYTLLNCTEITKIKSIVFIVVRRLENFSMIIKKSLLEVSWRVYDDK